MKKAIILGASSGIGRDLGRTLAKNGYTVGLMARRIEMLNDLQSEIPSKTYVGYLDIVNIDQSIKNVAEMIEKMGGLDLMIINSGTGFLNPELEWEKEKQTLDVNVYGFTALADFSFSYFSTQKNGHLVGISSIGALRGNPQAPAYNASKAYISNYLEGLRVKSFKEALNITVTDIKPGYVDTDMAKGEGKFWVATPHVAAEQIFGAIRHKKDHAYITHRWRLIGWLLKIMPGWLYARI